MTSRRFARQSWVLVILLTLAILAIRVLGVEAQEPTPEPGPLVHPIVHTLEYWILPAAVLTICVGIVAGLGYELIKAWRARRKQ